MVLLAFPQHMLATTMAFVLLSLQNFPFKTCFACSSAESRKSLVGPEELLN